ncbi:hypothetical protein KIN20_030753 [Parelaphostrongylus tenuis]|uniref:Uncharacterized protein n=1 Tax=Parelaphostrongylus tenuis TaxID=148309 RepID=A0AAD5R485_PARTN|nr:hypothetical protein KIN20_030753 [Parelaphostrongylus tenuis]
MTVCRSLFTTFYYGPPCIAADIWKHFVRYANFALNGKSHMRRIPYNIRIIFICDVEPPQYHYLKSQQHQNRRATFFGIFNVSTIVKQDAIK